MCRALRQQPFIQCLFRLSLVDSVLANPSKYISIGNNLMTQKEWYGNCDKKCMYWPALLFCLFFSQQLFALPTRCGSFVVHTGENMETILEKCGEPDTIDSFYEKRRNNLATQYGVNGSTYYSAYPIRHGQCPYEEIEVYVEVWVYEFKNGRIRKSLQFENEQLTMISSLRHRRR
jgi:Protein of unknown function (DUF2845)